MDERTRAEQQKLIVNSNADLTVVEFNKNKVLKYSELLKPLSIDESDYPNDYEFTREQMMFIIHLLLKHSIEYHKKLVLDKEEAEM